MSGVRPGVGGGLNFEPIPGLPQAVNSLFAEEWALLDWLAENALTCDVVEYRSVVDLLIANGERIDAWSSGGNQGMSGAQLEERMILDSIDSA